MCNNLILSESIGMITIIDALTLASHHITSKSGLIFGCHRSRPDDAALALAAAAHVEKAAVCDGKDVRRQLAQSLVGVHLHMLGGVDGQQLVWVDCNQNGACVRL